MQKILKSAARASLRFVPTPLYYQLTGALAVGRHLVGAYPERVRIDGAPPLMDNFFDKEALFQQSADTYEAMVAPYVAECRWGLGRLYNGFFEAGDPELYYSMIRHNRPNTIIEVGSGHSTFFAMDALKKNKKGRVQCIDPKPLRPPPKGVTHLASRVEDISLDVFDQLKSGDILFIDSSHTTTEVQYHVDVLLPRLQPGVIVHHHDVTYPYAIYYENDRRNYAEPDQILEYYWANQNKYDVMVSTSYFRYRYPDRWYRAVPNYRWNPTRTPGSLWTRVKN